MTTKQVEELIEEINGLLAELPEDSEEAALFSSIAKSLCYMQLTKISEKLVRILNADDDTDEATLRAIADDDTISGLDIEAEIAKLKKINPEKADQLSKVIALLEIDKKRQQIAEEGLEEFIPETASKLDGLLRLKGEAEESIASLIESVQLRDSGLGVINNSPVIKNLVARKYGDIALGTNEETGELAIFTLLSGYITPYEQEIIEGISKFKLDGQITENKKIWFTLGQLYRAMRHGAGTTRPTKEQKEELLQVLIKLSNDDRKLTFKLNNYLKVWGGFETNGGRLRILGFDELYGRIKGQEDILIILDNTPIICAVAENLQMYERIDQRVKAVQTIKYTLTLKEPITINGKPVKKRSFSTNEERRSFCKKYDITSDQIADYGESSKAWALSENRIALRNVIYSFVYSYIRARSAGSYYENKLNYNTIFERCDIGNHHEAIKRAKKDIAIILDHLIKVIPELKAWGYYKNKGEKDFSGIGVFLQQPKANSFDEWQIMSRKADEIGG